MSTKNKSPFFFLLLPIIALLIVIKTIFLSLKGNNEEQAKLESINPSNKAESLSTLTTRRDISSINNHLKTTTTPSSESSINKYMNLFTTSKSAKPANNTLTELSSGAFKKERWQELHANGMKELSSGVETELITESGQTVGITLTKIPGASALVDIGLQEGDIIRTVQGVKVINPTMALDLLRNHDPSNDLVITIERSGKRMAIDLTFE